jgi:hypothetical protein
MDWRTSRLVPDVHLAALALQHGLVLQSTGGDFARFPGLRWENPLAAGSIRRPLESSSQQLSEAWTDRYRDGGDLAPDSRRAELIQEASIVTREHLDVRREPTADRRDPGLTGRRR